MYIYVIFLSMESYILRRTINLTMSWKFFFRELLKNTNNTRCFSHPGKDFYNLVFWELFGKFESRDDIKKVLIEVDQEKQIYNSNMHFYLNKMITLYFTKTIQRCTVVSLLLITGYRIRTIYYLYCYPQTCSICCPNIRDATHASFTKIVSQFIALWINWITPLIGFNLQEDDFAEWKN